MNSAGGCKGLLSCHERFGQGVDNVASQARLSAGKWVLTAHSDRRNRSLAADATAGCNERMAFEKREIDLHPLPQDHFYHVAALATDTRDFVRVRDNPLGEEESDGQIAVVPGRSH